MSDEGFSFLDLWILVLSILPNLEFLSSTSATCSSLVVVQRDGFVPWEEEFYWSVCWWVMAIHEEKEILVACNNRHLLRSCIWVVWWLINTGGLCSCSCLLVRWRGQLIQLKLYFSICLFFSSLIWHILMVIVEVPKSRPTCIGTF